ncbi:MAG TPA: MerR family transcriptional regulator [Streptosporangiaceae bacterium]
MRAGLTIGEFAQLTQLSVRTLRRYHEGGLLAPATVDPDSGYRYYTAEQIPAAQIIHRLRELGMPLREVGEMLASPDPNSRAALVAAHLGRLESELQRTTTAVTSLRRLLQPPQQLAVELRAETARTVAAITGTVNRSDLARWYNQAIAELGAALAGQQMTGPPGGMYDNELFTEDRGAMIVYHPVANPPTVGRVRPVTLPAAELAVTVHRGAHRDLDISYGQLGAYVTDHALAVAGPVREAYLVGPRDTADQDSWRTEIGWPIFRVSPI